MLGAASLVNVFPKCHVKAVTTLYVPGPGLRSTRRFSVDLATWRSSWALKRSTTNRPSLNCAVLPMIVCFPSPCFQHIVPAARIITPDFCLRLSFHLFICASIPACKSGLSGPSASPDGWSRPITTALFDILRSPPPWHLPSFALFSPCLTLLSCHLCSLFFVFSLRCFGGFLNKKVHIHASFQWLYILSTSPLEIVIYYIYSYFRGINELKSFSPNIFRCFSLMLFLCCLPDFILSMQLHRHWAQEPTNFCWICIPANHKLATIRC